MCIRPQSIPVLDKRVDGFVIFKALADPRVLLDGLGLEATILKDFSGMVIKEPSMPTSFIYDIDQMEEVEAQYPSGNCDRVFEEHRMKVFDYLSDKERQYRYTVIKFPPGMKGSNLYFNKSADGARRNDSKFKLDTNPRFIHQTYDDGHGLSFQFVTTYCYWKVAIDGTQRTANEKAAVNNLDDLFAEAVRGMKRTCLKSPPPPKSGS